MRVFLIDGTYELFRQFFGRPGHETKSGVEVDAVRGVLDSVLSLIEDGARHVGVATDHVIESFRNNLWAGYKTGEGIDPLLRSQFPLLEEALAAMGVATWPMSDLEADDGLASAAEIAAMDGRVEQIVIMTPDKDLAQCVKGSRIVQFDRRNNKVVDEDGVLAKFGVRPDSIPDYLALVGDSADGFPGITGWGAKSAAAVLARYEYIEAIPNSSVKWDLAVRSKVALSSTLEANRDQAQLFKLLATLRRDRKLYGSVDEIEWRGPTEAFGDVCDRLEAQRVFERAKRLSSL